MLFYPASFCFSMVVIRVKGIELLRGKGYNHPFGYAMQVVETDYHSITQQWVAVGYLIHPC
jgi:hypothetical protein